MIVVDDDPLIGRALQRILEAQGFEIVVAANPAEALEELRARPVGLIISDYMMPGMDGVQFLVEARRLCPDAPRLLLTAMRELERTGGRHALCTMCIGVGQGMATVLERV